LPDQLRCSGNVVGTGVVFHDKLNSIREKDMDIVHCMVLSPFLPKTLYREYGYIKNPVQKANFAICPLAANLTSNDLTVKDNWLVSFGVYGTS